MTRLAAIAMLGWLLAAAPVSADSLVRLPLLPENPAAAGDSASVAWSRAHQLGGTEEATAFMFLPVATGYVQALASDGTMPLDQLPRLGPWTDALLIRFNAYDYTGEIPVDQSLDYAAAQVTLRYGPPAVGDSAVIPEPQTELVLQQAGINQGIWYLAQFPTPEAATAFEEDLLRQIRMTIGEDTYVFDLAPWNGLPLFSEPDQNPVAPSAGGGPQVMP